VSTPLEDYALLGDTWSAALVSRHGSVDWLCLPRFDSPACLAALIGTEDNGFWSLAPADAEAQPSRRYREGTLVLETTWTLGDARVRVVDAMVVEARHSHLVRQVIGESGSVAMRSRFKLRFDYGSVVPWVSAVEGGIVAIAGPDGAAVYADVPLSGHDFSHEATFTVAAGETVSFELAYFPSHLRPPKRLDVAATMERTTAWWQRWSDRFRYDGPHRELVLRSLLTLKALTFAPTGAIAAAPTMDLPEAIGGVRNWDYRYCWIRDAAFVLVALHNAGYHEAARTWREWLIRAAAGNPEKLQILYGLHGERRVMEFEANWLRGYDGSQPVRVGNAASRQFQLDVYGELVDAIYQARRQGLPPNREEWALTKAIVATVEARWREPDQSLWEIRGTPRCFVHSRVLAWVALDRAIRFVERFGVEGPVERWRRVRDEIHDDVCTHGWDPARGTFTQSYGSKELDAATLLIPIVGFLPPDDPRVLGTIANVERELMRDGFLLRYSPRDERLDGLPPGEGSFLVCSFWLVDAYAITGRREEARALFERLAGVANDVGLLSEEYDVKRRRLVGNFPQAFSHVGLVNSAFNLHAAEKPLEQRSHTVATVGERR
jgi:GH15 family glucan-1,4-alpha-glucosidase